MFRLLAVVFPRNAARSESAEHAHESPAVMVIPLILLRDSRLGGRLWARSRSSSSTSRSPSTCLRSCTTLFWRSFSLAPAGSPSFSIGNRRKIRVVIPLFANRLYIDDFYNWLVQTVQDGLALLSGWADRWIVDLFVVQTSSRFTWACGYILRFLQLGNIQAYAFFFGAGVVGLIYILLGMMSPLLCLVVLPVAGAILIIAGTQARNTAVMAAMR